MGAKCSLWRSVSSEDRRNLGSRKSNIKRQQPYNEKDLPQPKRKKAVIFDNVTVYYFPRAQGFISVPSHGGSTLGMSPQHAYAQHLSISEHADEKRRLHRQAMLRLPTERLNAQVAPVGSGHDSISEEEQSNASESQLDLDSRSSLKQVPPRQREALLRAAGITEINPIEKDECMKIRLSRKLCGCRCKGYCDPDKCSCSQSGIKCQVQYPNPPCGCSHFGCGNPNGRIELNYDQVRQHFKDTLLRLNFENKEKLKEEEEEGRQKRQPRCSSSS